MTNVVKMLDLFSGIGGFSLAATWCWGDDLEVVGFVEIDKFCQKVLRKHWPDVPIYDDIKKVDGYEIKRAEGTIDLICGGFPCQPFSQAGKQRGEADDRHLWPEMFRVIKEVQPRWVIGENVAGFINMALDEVCAEMEGQGYEVQPFVVPACAVNAPHRRDRVWIVGYAEHYGHIASKVARSTTQREDCSAKGKIKTGQFKGSSEQCRVVGNSAKLHINDSRNKRKTSRTQISEFGNTVGEVGQLWTIEPDVGRVAHGVRSRVDRLKSLGNAIVPQVVYPIMCAIRQLEGEEDDEQ